MQAASAIKGKTSWQVSLLLAEHDKTAARKFVDVAGDQLLAKKHRKELLQSYDHRRDVSVEFMKMVRPGLEIRAGALVDPQVPTTTKIMPARSIPGEQHCSITLLQRH